MELFFFFKQKTAYEMRISDWSSDVCSSDLSPRRWAIEAHRAALADDAASIDDFGVDESEDAAAYLADFLRVFGDVGVDVLLLQESAESEPADAEGLAAYPPVLQVASPYRWAIHTAGTGWGKSRSRKGR